MTIIKCDHVFIEDKQLIGECRVPTGTGGMYKNIEICVRICENCGYIHIDRKDILGKNNLEHVYIEEDQEERYVFDDIIEKMRKMGYIK